MGKNKKLPPAEQRNDSIPELPSSSAYIRSVISIIATAISVLPFTFGGYEMSIGDSLGPWVMALGALAIALIIIISGPIWNTINKHSKLISLLICVGFCAILVVPTYVIVHKIVTDQAVKLANTVIFYGEITPDNKANPVPSSMIPSDNITLLLGDHLVVTAKSSERYILSKVGVSFLTIDIGPEGNMILSTDISDHNNRNVVRIIKNEFNANPAYAFNPKQPNAHSLIVRDSEGQDVLNVDFINPTVMRITGTFYFEGFTDPIRILPSGGIAWADRSLTASTEGYSVIHMADNLKGVFDFK